MTYTKNILIVALVVINVFFLAIFGWGLYRDNAEKKQMYRELYEIMAQNSILLDTGGIHPDGEIYRMDTTRDPDEERALAEALLGETTTVDQGENIITTYVGKDGQAVFRNGGEFQINFTRSVFQAGDNIESTTKKTLKTMAVEVAYIDVSATADNETVTAVCSWMDYRIFNCRLHFVYVNGSLIEISGRHAANIRMTGEKTEMSAASAAMALMRFLHEVKSEKYTCAAIMDIRPGYDFVATVYGDGSLRPVWRIQADSGIYYVDAETGGVEQGIE